MRESNVLNGRNDVWLRFTLYIRTRGSTEFLLNPAGEEAVCDGPSTSTDDDADIDDSVPILSITAK